MSFKTGPGKRGPRFAGKVVCGEWDDASFADNQMNLEEVNEGYVVLTYGLCARESNRGLTVVMDTPRDMDVVRHSAFIPWKMIRSVKNYGTEYKVKGGK